jgi:signal transduction histidine kinase
MAQVAQTVPAAAPSVSASTARSVVLTAGLALAAVAAWIALTTGYHVHRGWLAFYWTDQVVSALLVGLYWWKRRPQSRFGPVLAGYGLLAALVALQGASGSVAYSLGVLWGGPLFVATVAVILAFPAGRLSRTADRVVVWTAVAVVAALEIPYLLMSPRIATSDPLANCAARCPDNALFVSAHPRVVAAIVGTMHLATAGIALAAAAVIAVRFVRASRPRRRSLAFGDAAGAVYLIAFSVYRLALQADLGAQRLRWVLVAALALLAWGFLAALIQAEVFAGRVLRETVARSLEHPTVAEAEAALREVLDDPQAKIGFRARWGGFVDVEGNDLQLPSPGSSRRMQPIARAGAPAVLVYDAGLEDEPELLLAAGAALLGCENALLEEEIGLARISSARVLEAGALERKRLERNLHDGVQQQLVALCIKLELARDLAAQNPDLRERLAELRAEIDHTVVGIRALAQQIYPPLLAEEGLGAALRAAANRYPVRVRVECKLHGPRPAGLDAAVYRCCIEALDNVAAHAGPEAAAMVAVVDYDDELRFTVMDDGCGFDPLSTPDGPGFASIRDRVAAFGGSMSVDSSPGRGTIVSGSIPARQAERGFSAADSARKTSVAVTRRLASSSSGSSSLEKIDPM